jgi:ribosomal protein S18 acetylase RimI-like enzyme
MSPINIRHYQSEDLERLIPLWHESKKRAFPYVEVQQQYTLEDDRNYFTSTIVPGRDVWLAETEDKLVGFIALEDDLVDLLFVDIDDQGQGIGTALVDKAKDLSVDKLRAYVFQKNHIARRFFEKLGFVEIGYGVSPPPEDEPDVELLWVRGGTP